ncbi:MAG: hypothetical protein KAY32_00305 [Candidatus Eisenbacteria sp.]|nr:hypothetical protein [Candidatus Eisenbacteria bacterium]
MEQSGREGHILVWMRDAILADRVRSTFGEARYRTTWAAALPEAIAAVDREFPSAVACTLLGKTPSLMDLETLLAYRALGRHFASLPPLPIWALTEHAAELAREIDLLDLPVRLVPLASGAEELVRQVCAALRGERCEQCERRTDHELDSREVLLLLEKPEQARFLARYLAARGIRARVVRGPDEALGRLRRRGAGILVCGDFTLRQGAGSALWGWLERQGHRLPVLLVASDGEWLTHVSPLALPQGIVNVLAQPIQVGALEAALRRLLRLSTGPGAGGPICGNALGGHVARGAGVFTRH